MFSEANKDVEFPPLERKINPSTRYSTKPTIIPSKIGTDGKPKVLSQAEEVLNWQTENAQAQNSLLKRIDDKVTKMLSSMHKSEDKLDYLSSKMNSQKISKSIEDDSKSSTPVSSPKRHDTGKGHYFQDSQDPYSQMMIKENEQLATPESSVNTGSEDDLLTNLSDEDSITTASSEAQLADLSVLMVSTGPDPIYESPDESPIQSPRNRTTKPTRGPWFTLDDVDPSQWRSRLIEFGAWLDTRFMKGDTESYKIIEEFGCRMTGILKEWYANLGPVGQNTFHELGNAVAVLGALHEEFIGDGALTDRKIRQEFFEMKCCSLKLKDLDKHYLRMLKRFYLLNGLNDPSLKSTYVSSLPTEIQPELARMAAAMNKDFTGLTMGRIHQMTQEAIDKLCRQHEYFSNMLKDKGKYAKACRKPFLEIKCKDKDRCYCPKKKFKGKKFPSHFKKKKYKKPYRFFKKREIRGKNPGQRCYICGKRGHFAKTCPNKAQKAIKMITSLQLKDRDEVESLYSEQSSADEDTVFTLQDSFSDTSSSDADDSSQEEDTVPIFAVDQCDSMKTVVPPHPNVEIEILPSKYEKPIKAIGFLDTSASKTMMNPEILSPHFWKKEDTFFIAADGKIFKSEVISRAPVGIRLFRECIIWSKVVGTKLPNKDILIGMDVFTQAHRLLIHPTGLRFKGEFKPFVPTSKLYSLSEVPPELEEIKIQLKSLCSDNHKDFTHPKPLWKNPDFFVQLPFKLNEDVNPTKASHPGMSPSDLKLAKQECQELLRQGLIEQTTSNWACQAFYVEKRSERLRGKKRLVVDYKPLNHFLKDDKFPLPKTSTLPILLKESKIFSKFDLKSGFWQLGVDPSERHKTAFCIPNAQYQWTVLPFGLKVAPSLFQKAITKILEPLLDNAIIYIDDILLFSKDMESHKRLLSQFLERANLYGIMFSEKKIQLAQQEIDFLGMKFSQGSYQPQPHIAEELLNFPEENLSVKKIQQFLGIINYIRDFIPKVARYTSPLSKLLKKNPPPWGPEQTKAVQEIKKIA
uniref:Polyprotein n=1 Tax=Cajanus cajan TaxID=3821 RepID=A0A151T3Y1_CAJCA|nr:polyprotein [Cajanus cajan]